MGFSSATKRSPGSLELGAVKHWKAPAFDGCLRPTPCRRCPAYGFGIAVFDNAQIEHSYMTVVGKLAFEH